MYKSVKKLRKKILKKSKMDKKKMSKIDSCALEYGNFFTLFTFYLEECRIVTTKSQNFLSTRGFF